VLHAARRMGLEPVMWSVTGYDWNAPSVEHIERKVTGGVRGGDVILLHDGGHRAFGADRSHTVTATDRLISRYHSEGYRFVTIPEMMEKPVLGGGPALTGAKAGGPVL
jgi:peptidoglycan-N-acetylglucosamine deacetylase